MGVTAAGIAAVAGAASTAAQAGLAIKQAGNKPKIPSLPDPRKLLGGEDSPGRGDDRVQAASSRKRQEAASRAIIGGRRSTIGTSPQGLIQPATTTKKTLLGT